MSGGGRRALRAELEATWNVWDARRPIRRDDMAPPEPAEAFEGPKDTRDKQEKAHDG